VPAGLPPPDTARLASAGAELAADLRDAGFHENSLAAAEGTAPGLPEELRLPLVREELARTGDVASLLLLLLTYDGTLDPGAATRLGPWRDRLERCGLVATALDGTGVSSPFCVVPFGELVLVSDKRHAGSTAVMPPAESTAQLLRVLPPAMDGAVLDVGAGPGTLALAAARRGADVVATDVNPRASAFGHFNAALNQLACDIRTGDLFEAVGDRSFDLVVGQPPFLALPPTVEPVVFLHGGARGHELSLRMISGVPDVLSPGGVCLFRFDAPVMEQSLLDQIADACDPKLDLAVFTVQAGSRHHVAGAAGALEHTRLGRDRAEVVSAYHRHLSDLDVHKTEAALVVGRRAGDHRPGWRRHLALREQPRAWEAVARYIAAQDVAELAVVELDATPVAPAPGARLITREPLADHFGQAPAHSVEVVGDRNLATESAVSAGGATLFRILAGGVTVATAAARFATQTGVPEDVAADLVRDSVRLGLRRGLLTAGRWVSSSEPSYGSGRRQRDREGERASWPAR
jgi:methylase of polypeptide subunit release factors